MDDLLQNEGLLRLGIVRLGTKERIEDTASLASGSWRSMP